MNINQEVLHNALKLETNLHLSTKEAYSLEEIIEILNILSQNEKDSKENLKAIIKYFSDEAPLIINIKKDDISMDTNKLFINFEKFYQFLEGLIGKNEKFPKMMSIIFYNEYLKIPNYYFRNKLLDIIISRNDFIYNCYPLIKLILKRVGISMKIRDIQNNFNILKNGEDRLVDILNSKKNDFLDQIIIQLFEHLSLEFFDNINKIDEKSDKKDKECFKNFFEKKVKGEKNYEKYMIFEKINHYIYLKNV